MDISNVSGSKGVNEVNAALRNLPPKLPSDLQVVQGLIPSGPPQDTANPMQHSCIDLTQSSAFTSSLTLNGGFVYNGCVDDESHPLGPGQLIDPHGTRYAIEGPNRDGMKAISGWRMMPPKAMPEYIAYKGGRYRAGVLCGSIDALCSNGTIKKIRALDIWDINALLAQGAQSTNSPGRKYQEQVLEFIPVIPGPQPANTPKQTYKQALKFISMQHKYKFETRPEQKCPQQVLRDCVLATEPVEAPKTNRLQPANSPGAEYESWLRFLEGAESPEQTYQGKGVRSIGSVAVRSKPQPRVLKKRLEDGAIAYGLKILPNGQRYLGGLLNNRIEGQGKLTDLDGFECEGYFNNGVFVKGKVISPNKFTYEGSIENGKFHGQGTLIHADGSVYQGNFDQGEYHGYGVWKDQGQTFEGMFVNNFIVDGMLTYPDGTWYKGEFRSQRPCGMGEQLLADKKTHFFGSWLNGLPLRGILTFPNGNTYSGEFLAGKPNGAGTLNYLNGDVYDGAFADGQSAGKGRLRYRDGRVYEGMFANGHPNGKGKLTYFDGTVKRGQFKNGEVQGFGSITYPDKMTYTGPIENGEPHGDEGTLTFRNGETYTGPFFRGCYQTSVVLTDGRIYNGAFRNGIMDGIGRLELLDGSTYLGEFKNGLAHGFGAIERADGTAWTGNFEEGQPLPETGIEITKHSGSYASENDPMDMQNTIYYELEELGYYWLPQE